MARPKTKGRKGLRAEKARHDWDRLFTETDAPSYDLFAEVDLADHCELETALEDLISTLESGRFLI